MKNTSDISKNEDLAIAVMNLISIEEHLFFTEAKTKKDEYLEVMDAVRSLRKEALKELLTNTEGELWCISKHLLAASMRMMETGNKFMKEKNREKAKFFYKASFDLYALFWMLQQSDTKSDKNDGRPGKKPDKVAKKV